MGARAALVLAAALALLLASSSSVFAATVGTDPTFGVAGVSAPPLPDAAADAKAGIVDLAAAPNGGVYGALTGLGRPAYFGLVRLDEAGQPDPSFGAGGYTAPFAEPSAYPASSGSGGSGPEAEAVAVQPDGKVVVAGGSVLRAYVAESGYTHEFLKPLLVRYLSDGSLDPSFGSGGSVAPEGVGPSLLHDMAVTADGRILTVADDAVYAFRPDGSPDSAFGKRGRALVGPRRLGGYPRAISLLPDGRFLVAGYRDRGRLLLARFRPGGGLDRSFGRGDGVVTLEIPSRRKCCGRAALAVGPDGRSVVAVNAGAPRPRVFVARFGPSGRRDRSFGGGDSVVALPRRFAEGYGVAVAPYGAIYATGLVEAGGPAGPFIYSIARIGPEGDLDQGFGSAGIETVERGEAGIAGAALTLPDGRVLVGGSYLAATPDGEGTRTTLLLTRFGPSG
jgi:uncharacterized delta-60 repeat protein